MEETKQLKPYEELIELADNKFKTMLKEGDYKKIMDAMICIGDYSLRNQMLILEANPNATHVEGMNGWNYRGKSIKPGEKGIKILAPTYSKEVVCDGDNASQQQITNQLSGYRIHFVFDESQTNGIDKKAFKTTPEMLVENIDIVKAALLSLVKGYEIKEINNFDGNITSRLNTEKKTIELNASLSEENKIRVLINQIAAANIVMRDRRNFNCIKTADMEALEISAVNYIVANKLGLTTEKLIEPDVSTFSEQDFSKFSGNISLIRSISQKMLLAVEGKLEYEIAKQKRNQEAQTTNNLQTNKQTEVSM